MAKLNVEKQRALVHLLVGMYQGKMEAWQGLARYCCFKKQNAVIILQCLLLFVDWNVVRNWPDAPERGL